MNEPINLLGRFETKAKSITKSRPVDPDEKALIVNTSTGEREYPGNSDLVHEKYEDSISVMQTLCIQLADLKVTEFKIGFSKTDLMGFFLIPGL